jgi:hypothetical protein
VARASSAEWVGCGHSPAFVRASFQLLMVRNGAGDGSPARAAAARPAADSRPDRKGHEE